MSLPNAEHAIVDDRKIIEYLLSPQHSRGAAKAEFFRRFGFSLAQWTVCREALFAHAQNHEVSAWKRTPFGEAFEVNGRLTSPDGRNPWVRVVWFVRTGETTPRLATAIPSKGPGP